MRNFMGFIIVMTLAIVTVSCDQNLPTSVENSESSSIQANAASSSDENALAKGFRPATYEITLYNLTPSTGSGTAQPLSPAVVGTHRKGFDMFHHNGWATQELEDIAEQGDNSAMLAALENAHGVYDYTSGSGPVLPGGNASFTINGIPGFTKLSMVMMLGNTNDGVAAADAVELPWHGSKTYYLKDYDAGTEVNTELFDHLACCSDPGSGITENKKISAHPGILGIGDQDPAIYGWEGPAAKIVVTRVE